MIKTAIKILKVKKVNYMLNFEKKDNPLIIHLPVGVGYEDESGVNTFEKIKIEFFLEKDIEVFSVCVDDFLYIDKNYQLIDDMGKAAMFGKDTKDKTGKVIKEHGSLIERAMSVCTAICHGEIKLGEINKVED